MGVSDPNKWSDKTGFNAEQRAILWQFIRRALGMGGGLPGPHASTHEDGGSDEINVTGLSGLLADPQTALPHAVTHQNGGSDEINVTGLSGLLADPQNPGGPAGGDLFGTYPNPQVLDDSHNHTAATLPPTMPPGPHATTHEDGGSDEIDVTGLSGLLADPQTPLPHAPTHEDGGSDEIDVTGLSGLLADPQTPTAHAATHQNGGADEINVAGLSGLLADPQTPLAHATTHQNGGTDEINVAGLSGLLADPQTPTAHAVTHQNGGSDEINVTGLSGLLADGQTPLAHATTHEPGGSDPMTVDAAPSVGSLRTLGTGPNQAAAGNDPRLSDSRTPMGPAGGDLRGTYPDPIVHRASQDFALPGDISPTAISGVVTDYNPTGLSTATVIRITKAAGTSLAGLAGGFDGRIIAIYNSDPFDTLLILNESLANPTAVNRFHLPTSAEGDFPLTPGDSVVFRYDAVISRWVPFSPVGATNGRFMGLQVFSTAGAFTWTRPSGVVSILVRLIGAGGGGGGSTQVAVSAAAGGGGAGGSYCEKFYLVTASSYSGSVGAGGIAGIAGVAGAQGGTGGNGGNSTFDVMTGIGGIGGLGGIGSTTPLFSAGGSAAPASGGDINSSASPGLYGLVLSVTQATGGQGGSSVWGGGGEGRFPPAGGVGVGGDGKGGGGGGGCTINGGPARAGGAGSIGLVVVWHFS